MSYRTLVSPLPQFVQHYPYSSEKTFDPRAVRGRKPQESPLPLSFPSHSPPSASLPHHVMWLCKIRNTAVEDKLLCSCHKDGTLHVRAYYCAFK